MKAETNGRPGEDQAGSAPVVDRDDHVFARLGLRDVDAPEGADLAMILPITPRVINPRGGLQGGLLATLVDVVAGRAADLSLPDGETVATADLNIRFLSAVTVGPAFATARVLRSGKALIVMEVEVRDQGRDVLAAVATLSFARLRLRPGQHRPPGSGTFG